MAVENAGDAAVETGMPEEILVPAGQEGQAEKANAETAPSEAENMARRLGWKPKEDFKAPANRPNAEWLDADAYIERIEKEAPLRNERLRFQDQVIERQQKQLDALMGRLEKIDKNSEEQLERTRTAEARGFDRARSELERQMDTAAYSGDQDAYREAKRNLIELHKQFPGDPAPTKKTEDKKTETEPPKKEQPTVDPVTDQWVRENQWFAEGSTNFDWEMNAYAVIADARIGKAQPGLSTRDRLEEVKSAVKKRFPEKFENPNRKASATVATPGTQQRPSGGKKTRTVADLPEDGKAALARLQRIDPKFKVETYLQNFQWDKP